MSGVGSVLEELDSVPWHKLITFYGLGSAVPTAIRDLVLTQDARQRDAYSFLRENLEHQDGVVQATVFATPTLLRLVGVGCVASELILELLTIYTASAAFTLEEIWDSPHEATVASLERFRGCDASLWNGPSNAPAEMTHADRFSDAEWWAWSRLVIADIAGASPLLSDLARGPNGRVAILANELLETASRWEAT